MLPAGSGPWVADDSNKVEGFSGDSGDWTKLLCEATTERHEYSGMRCDGANELGFRTDQDHGLPVKVLGPSAVT